VNHQLKNYCQKIIDQIIHPPQGILRRSFITPTGLKKDKDRQAGFYAQQYDWDLYFEGVALNQIAPEKMPFFREALLNFLDFTTADGRTPRTISPFKFWDPGDQHKPFLIQGCLLASQALKDFSWINQTIWNKLVAFAHFWEKRQGFHGLVRWRSVLESGVDNNPTITNLPDFAAESVDASVYFYGELLALAKIAEKIGQDPQPWQEKANNLKQRINFIFWHAEDQIYYDIYNFSDQPVEPIKVRSWTCFTPLWLRLPSQKQAKAMIERYLLNPKEFLAPFGLRSLSRQELLYNTAKRGLIWIHFEKRRWIVSNWQGPVWVISNWLLTEGLINYGYRKEAQEIRQRVLQALEKDLKTTGTLHENYHPETGEGLWAPDFGSWNLLALNWLKN